MGKSLHKLRYAGDLSGSFLRIPTANQLAYAERLGVPTFPNMTRKELSDRIALFLDQKKSKPPEMPTEAPKFNFEPLKYEDEPLATETQLKLLTERGIEFEPDVTKSEALKLLRGINY